MASLIRLLLLLGALLVFTALIAVHGFVRAVVLLVAVVLATSVPRTRAWKGSEYALVQLTGSRRRAAVLVMVLVIGTLTIVNLYQLAH